MPLFKHESVREVKPRSCLKATGLRVGLLINFGRAEGGAGNAETRSVTPGPKLCTPLWLAPAECTGCSIDQA